MTTLVNGLEFSLTKLPTSIAGIRIIDNAAKLADQYGIHQISGFDLVKLGKAAKLMDNMCYIPKFIASVESFVVTVKQYDSTKKVESVVKIFFATVKVVGDGAASMKFFIAMGMSFYVGKTELGYIKSVCSVISVGKFFADVANGKSKETGGQLVLEATARFCSIWLNGVGALVQYVGKEAFLESGKSEIPDVMWPTIGMLASVASAVKDCKRG